MPAFENPREPVLAAALVCAGRVGLTRITVEDVARQAGVSRATVYRWFPGGRDQLVDELITWEVGRFLGRVAEAIDDAVDFPARLARALAFAHRAIEEHEVLQQTLATEPGGVLPQLRETTPLVVAVIRDYLVPYLRNERLHEGVEVEEAADYLARMIVSYMSSEGRWDLTDAEQVDRLVRIQFLAGVLADTGC